MNDYPPPRRANWAIVALLLAAFALGILVGRFDLLPSRYAREPASLVPTFSPFWEAWHKVKENYVDQASADDVRMERGALRGMLASLGDVGHTTYLTPEDLQRLEQGLTGSFEGVGARLTVRDRRPTVLQVLPNSPALAAGLKSGDVLLEVDGHPVAGLSLEQIVQKVRGPAGTEVRLRVQRSGETPPRDVPITRGKVDVATVTMAMLPGSPVAHVAIGEFGVKADKQLRAALDDAKSKGAKALIIDVRGNPGGLKQQAVAVSSEFLKEGEVVFLEEDAKGRQEKVTAKGGGVAPALPMCVLIDGGSASSSEIFAGAMKDHGRAKLVGTRTFGTGTVLQPFPLSDGSAILLAVAKWLTPNGHELWHKGIEPDVEVRLPEGATILLPELEQGLTEDQLKKSQDKQLLKALELLREQLRGGGDRQP